MVPYVSVMLCSLVVELKVPNSNKNTLTTSFNTIVL